jgi:hypothetical protein
MADYATNLPSIPYNPMQGIQTLQGVLGIQAQKLDIQKGQQELQQVTQKNRELTNLASFTQKAMQDPAYKMPDGSPNIAKFQNDAMAVAPVYGQESIGRATENFRSAVNTRRDLQSLSGEQNKALSGFFQSVAGMENPTHDDILNAAGQARANNVDPAFNRALDRALMNFDPSLGPKDIRKRAGVAANTLGGMTGVTPTTVDTGAGVQGATANNYTGAITPAGTAVRRGLSPGVQILTDSNGKQYRYNTQTNQIEGQIGQPAPGTTQGQGGFTQPIPNQGVKQQAIEDTRRADADYGVNRHVNDALLRLSQDTSTGPGTEVWHHVLGALGAPVGSNNVSDYQTIGAYLDRQAALSAKQMGLPDTNAGLATAASLSGTTSYQPKALQTKVKLTDALVEGAHQYRQGLDRVIGTGPNQDLSRYDAYRAAWAQSFDPNVYRLENAVRRKDTEEVQSLKKELGPDGLKALAQKRRNLIQLSQGQIPGG